jgi:hypothetical protein
LIQRWFLQSTVLADLNQIASNNDGSFSKKDLYKIKWYYGSLVTVIMGESMCKLTSKPMTRTERTCLTYTGALTGLFDDFYDEKNTPIPHLLNLIQHPESTIPRDKHEELFLVFWQKALDASSDRKLLIDALLKVHEAQVLSLQQTNPAIDRKTILDISEKKGGYSLLFYLAATKAGAFEHYKDLFFMLGKIGQLENDVFDIYKDSIQQIRTLFTMATDMNSEYAYFNQLLKDFNSNYMSITTKHTNQLFVLHVLNLFFSRAKVCFDQLITLQATSNNVFDLKIYHRKQLICDMELWKNNVQQFQYFSEYLQNLDSFKRILNK